MPGADRAASKKPSVARFFILPSVLFVAAAVADSGTLTVDDVIRLALSEPHRSAVIDATIGRAEGDYITAAARRNPVLQYQREGADGLGGAGSENFVQIQQRFDVSGRRALGRDAAHARVDAARYGAGAARTMLAVDAAQRFYTALADARRLALAESHVGELVALEAQTLARTEAGDASRYELERVRQETGFAPTAVERARGEAFVSRRALGAIIGDVALVEEAALTGELLPPAPPAMRDLEARVSDTPRLAALAAEAEAADRDLAAAGRIVPDVTLGAGFRAVEGAGGETGLLLSMNVPLPLFDRRQGEIVRSAAAASDAGARHAIARREALAQAEGLAFQLRTLRSVAVTYRRTSLASAATLERIASTAYAAGEISVLEAIDALHATYDAMNRLIELELDARTTELELQRLLPGDVP